MGNRHGHGDEHGDGDGETGYQTQIQRSEIRAEIKKTGLCRIEVISLCSSLSVWFCYVTWLLHGTYMEPLNM